MAGEKLNIGLIGAGRIGRVHANNLISHISGARLLMIADMNEETARSCAAELDIPGTSNTHLEVLAHQDIDAVVICSSTDSHAAMIEDAAAAGKHIFCEKPIDLDLSRIDRALKAVERAGVKLQIGFNRRFDVNVRLLKAGIDKGDVGRPHRLHIISRDPSPPPATYIKVSGGLFLDMTIHDFDMARFLMGCEATEVYAAAGVLVDPAIGELGDVDTAVIVLRFENGAIGTIENSRKAVYGYDQRIEVFGSEGSLESRNEFPNTVLRSGAQRIERSLPMHFFIDRYAGSYVSEMQAFVDAVIHDRLVLVTGEDGRIPVVMGMASKRSLMENRPVLIAEVEGGR